MDGVLALTAPRAEGPACRTKRTITEITPRVDVLLRSAYLLSTGPLLAIVIVTALVASRLLPAWS